MLEREAQQQSHGARDLQIRVGLKLPPLGVAEPEGVCPRSTNPSRIETVRSKSSVTRWLCPRSTNPSRIETGLACARASSVGARDLQIRVGLKLGRQTPILLTEGARDLQIRVGLKPVAPPAGWPASARDLQIRVGLKRRGQKGGRPATSARDLQIRVGLKLAGHDGLLPNLDCARDLQIRVGLKRRKRRPGPTC